MKKYFFLFCLLFNSIITANENESPWIVMEKGKLSFKEGDFGQALRYFKIVNEKEGTNPEADYWIGKIFQAEGEYDLAEKQFRRALSNKNNLFIKKEEINILYDLRNIYKIRKNYKKYETTLLDILKTDKKQNKRLDEKITDTYLKKGIDQLVKLYRSNKYSLIKANSDLGIFYLESGRHTIAVKYLVNSILAALTKSIEETRNSNPAYTFDNLKDYLEIADKDRFLTNYLNETELYKNLYYLGVASYFNGDSDLSREVLKICSSADNGFWGRKAEYYYNNPEEIKKIIQVN